MKLQDKAAIVTGAGSGMGKAIAIRFAAEGAKVIVSDINGNAAEATAAEIRQAGGEAVAQRTDVTNEQEVQALIQASVDQFGTLDILVNNAGILDNFVSAKDMTDELWEKVFAVNATGPMRTTRQALPIFLDKGKGNIINIVSVGGLFGSRAGAAYTASKHAAVGFTRNVGFQYAGKGIRCNGIAPGSVETNIGNSITAPDSFGMERAMAGGNLSPRNAKPDEIAAVALFLASDDSSFVNGAIVTADGGWTAY
ncbi:SDR family oxidoreductase [Gorillibacterium sp. sgz500922]|uniref:SDR family oxidoreductase n=1 Tax=Gorillibacterium sp. sgz500922 TaxID=3446694 RepID=UPI003F670AC0